MLAASMISPVTSFTTGDLRRGPTAEVVADADGALGIDKAAAVHTGSTCRLVTVTNRFDQEIDVTVALRDDSTHYGSLVVDGLEQGNSTTVTLASGDSRQIDVTVDDDDSYDGETIYYHVTADGSSIDVTATDRRTPIDNSSSAECGLL
ncbi:hypothetical protein BRC81_04835 [Halobacteriales archaeon QS_1_68_20]|nr:MAG: hypothetical protein BRC81_04835 [Halobacteriales archaeon QS_1_68_20]